ncbi:MAG: hypothetical protein ACJAVI_003363 [Candidatus Azotimanducaceae bacterium]|jgi:hypothetical protein
MTAYKGLLVIFTKIKRLRLIKLTGMQHMSNIVGWREWVSLPDIGIPALKAKIDTGAKTSALHAVDIELFDNKGIEYVRFNLQPVRKRQKFVLNCEAPLLDKRFVRDSGGHTEERFVIQSSVQIGAKSFITEITLTNRDDMLFPMLLGRRAMQAVNIIVDCNQSYSHGKYKMRQVYSTAFPLNIKK